jgi:TrmH family RNA methyltransferase
MMPAGSLEISSTTNPRIKAAAILRDRRGRESSGLTLVDGAREIGRALAARVEVAELFACLDLVRSDEATAALDSARATGVAVTSVSRTVLQKLAFGDRSDGLVAVVRTPPAALGALRLPAVPLIVVVDSIEKPGNLGAILRSADGAGVDALIAAEPRTDVFNPNAIRTSLGTIFSIPIAIATTAETIAWLRAAEINIIVARVDGAIAYTAADLQGPVAVVLGSEARGLGVAWSGPGMTAVSLPMLGIADSLNVSAAAAILLYEARRQRASP